MIRAYALILTIIACVCAASEPMPEPVNEDAPKKLLVAAGAKLTFDANQPGKPVVGIDLAGIKVTDGILKSLSRLTKLRGVNLQAAPITDEQVRYLVAIRGLEELVLIFCNKLTDQGLTTIKECAALKVLDLTRTALTDKGLAAITQGCKKLEDLNLFNTKVTNEGMAHLKPLESLASLSLGSKGLKIDKTGLSHLSHLPKIERLRLIGVELSATELRCLKTFPALSDLQVVSAGLTDESLEELRGVKKLVKLDIGSNPKVGDEGMKVVAGMKKLVRLDISFNKKITDEGMKTIAGMESLEELWMSTYLQSEIGINEVHRLKKLRALGLFMGTKADPAKWTDSILDSVAKMPELRTLWMAGFPLTDEGLMKLKPLRNLEALFISAPDVTDAGLAKLKKAIPTLKSIRTSNW